jgi:signal transduction histidine kinase
MKCQARQIKMKSFSLTRRIIAIVVTCQLLLAVGLILVAVLYARSQLKGAFDATLEGKAMSALALVQYSEPKPHVLTFDGAFLPPPSDPEHRDQYEIRASDGELIARSSGWQSVPAIMAQTDRRYGDFTLAGAPYRAVVLRNVQVLDKEGQEDGDPAAHVTVIYASSLVGNHLRLMKLAALVAATSILLLLATNLFAAWSIRRGLAPLHELAAQANQISVHNWNFSAPPGDSLATELSPFVHAIEAVLARLKESFRQQRDFTNDAAHELKTSVAIVKSTLQSLLHRPRTQHEYQTELEELLGDCGRLEDLLARMLRLARIEQLAENGVAPKLASTELTSTCEAAISRIRKVAEERKIALEFESPAAVYMHADPEDLELIWLNLLENAVQYSPEGSTVTLRVQRNGGPMVEVSVVDSGPGIPAAELPHIFERFHRGDPSRARSTGGFGLGLAICKALVDAYNGTIEAVNLPGQGTQMRVQLPAESS